MDATYTINKLRIFLIKWIVPFFFNLPPKTTHFYLKYPQTSATSLKSTCTFPRAIPFVIRDLTVIRVILKKWLWGKLGKNLCRLRTHAHKHARTLGCGKCHIEAEYKPRKRSNMLLLLLLQLLVIGSCSPPRCDPRVRGKVFFSDSRNVREACKVPGTSIRKTNIIITPDRLL